MKRLLLLATLCLVATAPLFAINNRLIPFQARLTNADGNPLNGVFPIIFVLYNSATGSEDNQDLWREVHTTASVVSGQVNVLLGTMTSLDALDFSQSLYLGITVGSESAQEMVPRHRIVPSFHAKSADWAATAAEATHATAADNALHAQEADNAANLGGVPASDYTSNTQVVALENRVAIAENRVVPPGTILPFAGETPPVGFMECDGSYLTVADYPDLHAAIGFIYGNSDFHTKFRIPDYRGIFLRGWDHGTGRDPDAAIRVDRGDGNSGDFVGTYEEEEVIQHNHNNTTDLGPGYNQNQLLRVSPGGNNVVASTLISPGSLDVQTHAAIMPYGGSETRPKNRTVLYIIKY